MTIETFQTLPIVRGSPWSGLQYFTTTRHDDSRDRLVQQLPGEPYWLTQVHGAHVEEATAGPNGNGPAGNGPAPTADAAVTTQRSQVLAVVTADCMPVVIADAQAGVVGVAHAGWRGLQAGVLENTVTTMRRALAKVSEHRDMVLRAWIGPSIRQASYEVGVEVYEAFVGRQPSVQRFFQPGVKPGKWQADLAGIATAILQDQGVATIEVSPYCTYQHEQYFYSYRRRAQTGRMVTVAWLL